jgi:hypothetical protein
MGCETVDVSSALPIDEQLRCRAWAAAHIPHAVSVSVCRNVPTLLLSSRNILGDSEVDCGVDAVGFEARGCGADASKTEQPASVLNAMMGSVRAGGGIGIPGLYAPYFPHALHSFSVFL